MSDKQDWISAERESKIFLRVIITDRIGPHLILLQIYYKNYNFRKIVKTKAMVFIYLFIFIFLTGHPSWSLGLLSGGQLRSYFIFRNLGLKFAMEMTWGKMSSGSESIVKLFWDRMRAYEVQYYIALS